MFFFVINAMKQERSYNCIVKLKKYNIYMVIFTFIDHVNIMTFVLNIYEICAILLYTGCYKKQVGRYKVQHTTIYKWHDTTRYNQNNNSKYTMPHDTRSIHNLRYSKIQVLKDYSILCMHSVQCEVTIQNPLQQNHNIKTTVFLYISLLTFCQGHHFVMESVTICITQLHLLLNTCFTKRKHF